MKSPKDIEHQIANTHIKPRPEMRSRILEEAFKAQAHLSDHAAGLSDSKWRFIMNSRITRAVVAAIILVATGMAIHQLGGTLDGTSVVWAQVVEKCHSFKTLTYTLKISGIFSHQNKVYDLSQTSYCSAFGKHKATRVARSSRTGEHSLLNQTLIDENGQMTFIDHESRNYFTQPLSEYQETAVDIVNMFKTLPSKADESLGNKVVEAQNTIGYLLKGSGVNVELWINEETHNPVLVEVIYDNSSESRMVYSNFRFDADVELSQFDIQIPADYSQRQPPRMTTEHEKASVDDFIFYLKLYAKHSEDGCFPDSVKISRDKEGYFESVSLSAIASASCTKSEVEEMSVKGPRTYQYLGQMRPENDWHYGGKGVLPGQSETPICWWKEGGSEYYTVIFADLSIGTLADMNAL